MVSGLLEPPAPSAPLACVEHTPVDDILAVEVVDRPEDLLYRLGGVLFRELALLTDAVEKLATGSKLGHDVVLVLQARVSGTVHGGSSRPTRLH